MEMHEKSVVLISKDQATVALILNIFLPGIGSMVAGCIAGGDHVFNNIIVGLL